MARMQWWYTVPVRFSCVKGCRACCERPGLVFFGRDDIARAARLLRMTQAEFKRTYLVLWGASNVVNIAPSSPCPFLVDKGCRIHRAKPRQCASYPFWPEYMESREAWEREMRSCPGMGTGPGVPATSIAAHLAVQRRNPV